jgi:hypothetical protein
MAARFWVTGGTGNWNSTTNWSATSGGASGASVPGSADTATFNASSGSGTATLDISPTIQTLTMTGFTGTLAFGTNTISLNSTGTIFTGATTMTVTGTPLIICTNSSASARTITPTAVTEANSISFRVTAGTGGLTLTANGAFRDLDFTDGTNPTGYAGALAGSILTIYGNFKASTGMTRTPGTQTYTFAATSGTKTINTAGVTFDNPFTFNGVGGTFQLQSALTSGASRTVSLITGTLDLNGYTLTTGIFAGGGSVTRRLIAPTTIVITGNAATVVSFGTTTGFTADFAPIFNLTYSGSTGTRTISYGATGTTIIYSPNILVTAGSDTVTTSGTTTVRDLFFSTSFTGTLGNATREIYGNLTIAPSPMVVASGALVTTFNGVSTQSITTNGQTLDFPMIFSGVGGSWQLNDALTSGATRTISLGAGTLNLASYTLTMGLFNSSGSTTRTLAFGTGKMVITGTNATVWTTSTSTNLTMTGTRTVEFTGVGVGGETRFISSGAISAGGTAANAANMYFKAGADIINLGTNNRAYGTLNFIGFSGSTLGNISPVIYGDLVLSTGMTVTGGTNNWIFAATTSQTITSNGKTINNPITFDGVGGTWTCTDALTLNSTSALTLTNGSLKLAAGTTSTVGSLVASGLGAKYLGSSTPGTQATLVGASSGTVVATRLSVQDNAVTGGATYIAAADAGNVNAGNNTGWTFTSLSPKNAGFLMLLI